MSLNNNDSGVHQQHIRGYVNRSGIDKKYLCLPRTDHTRAHHVSDARLTCWLLRRRHSSSIGSIELRPRVSMTEPTKVRSQLDEIEYDLGLYATYRCAISPQDGRCCRLKTWHASKALAETAPAQRDML